MASPSAGAACPPKLSKLLLDGGQRTERNLGDEFVESTQCAEALLLAEVTYAIVKILNRIADYGTLRFI